MITLPHNLDIEFKVLVDQIEEEQKMAYVTSVERIAMQEGWMKGQQEGKLEAAQTMVVEFGISVKDAATKLKVPLDDLIDYLNKHEQSKP
jgi:predicted transposase YdaD